jgi:F-type H+-transporting ATPase subunit delta
LFESKRIDEGTKHTIIKNILIDFENVIVEFLCILITHKQTGHLINIIDKFLSLAKKELNANKIEVITAKSLEEDTLKQLFVGLNYQIKSTVDPSIIGGMKIKHENKIFDNSVICQLNQLKKTLQNT